MKRALLTWLFLLMPVLLRAHTLLPVDGQLESSVDGAMELRLEIPAERLPLFVQAAPGSFATVGDLRAHEARLAACFVQSLSVVRGNGGIAPVAVRWPLLQQDGVATEYAAALLEFVTVFVRWEGLVFTARDVMDRFALPETQVVLTVRDGSTAIPPGESWGRTLGHSLIVGFQHIVPGGLDHILFVLGLYFAARRFRDLIWQVTMFTVAHSITLGLAMSGLVVLGEFWAPLVEIGIALSIVAVAVENCATEKGPGRRRYAIIGIFGLIHGLGFAGALGEVSWPAGRFFPALVSANLGIELGQLTVIAGAMLLTAWLWSRDWYRRRVIIPASVAIGLCGLYWAGERTLGLLTGG